MEYLNLRGPLYSIGSAIYIIIVFILYYFIAMTTLTIGYTMGNLPKDKAGIVSKEHICEGQSVHQCYCSFGHCTLAIMILVQLQTCIQLSSGHVPIAID